MRSMTHAASILCLPQPHTRAVPLARTQARVRGGGRAGAQGRRRAMHALLGEFDRHHERMIVRARERRAAVELTNLVDAGRVKTSVSEDDLLGKRLPRDEFIGDTNFRTLKALLRKVDENGFERVRAVRSLPPRPVSPCRARRSRPINWSFMKTFSKRRPASSTRTTGACRSPPSCRSTAGNRARARC